MHFTNCKDTIWKKGLCFCCVCTLCCGGQLSNHTVLQNKISIKLVGCWLVVSWPNNIASDGFVELIRPGSVQSKYFYHVCNISNLAQISLHQGLDQGKLISLNKFVHVFCLYWLLPSVFTQLGHAVTAPGAQTQCRVWKEKRQSTLFGMQLMSCHLSRPKWCISPRIMGHPSCHESTLAWSRTLWPF